MQELAEKDSHMRSLGDALAASRSEARERGFECKVCNKHIRNTQGTHKRIFEVRSASEVVNVSV